MGQYLHWDDVRLRKEDEEVEQLIAQTLNFKKQI
jgi:hypothetical protein